MNAAFKTLLLAALAAGGMSFCEVGLARNNGNVYWSIGVVAPGYPVGVGVGISNAPWVYPQPVYWGPPAVVYGPPVVYGPGPVYLAPGPIYWQHAPVYYYGHYYGGHYYGPGWRHGRHR